MEDNQQESSKRKSATEAFSEMKRERQKNIPTYQPTQSTRSQINRELHGNNNYNNNSSNSDSGNWIGWMIVIICVGFVLFSIL